MKAMDYYSFEELKNLDHILHQLAYYEITKGRLQRPDSMEEAAEMYEKVSEKFNYFKSLIQRGTCTLDFIAKDVMTRNGAIPQKRLTLDEQLDKIAEADQYDPSIAQRVQTINNVLHALLSLQDNDYIPEDELDSEDEDIRPLHELPPDHELEMEARKRLERDEEAKFYEQRDIEEAEEKPKKTPRKKKDDGDSKPKTRKRKNGES